MVRRLRKKGTEDRAGKAKGKVGPSVKSSVKVTSSVPVITRTLGVKGDSRTTPGSKSAEGQSQTRDLFNDPEQADQKIRPEGQVGAVSQPAS